MPTKKPEKPAEPAEPAKPEGSAKLAEPAEPARTDELKSALAAAPKLSQALAPTKELLEAAATAEDLVRSARSRATQRAQASDWRLFEQWARAAGAEPMPASPALVALWIGHLANQGRKPATIRRSLATLSVIHRRAGHESPTKHALVQDALRGAVVTLGAAQERAAPILPADLKAMVDSLIAQDGAHTLQAKRDMAVLLVGWAGALRRSELTGLRVQDIVPHAEGLELVIRKSKTDQAGEGASVALLRATEPRLCPVRALKAWVKAMTLSRASSGQESASSSRGPGRASGSKPGRGPDAEVDASAWAADDWPLFCRLNAEGTKVVKAPISTRAVDRLVKRWAARAALAPAGGAHWSAHSLRAGFITAASMAGRAEWEIARQTRHKKLETLRRYVRVPKLFDQAPGRGLL